VIGSSRSPEPRVAVLDDYQSVALTAADWSAIGPDATVTSYPDHLANADDIVRRLDGHDVVVAMRERTRSPRSLLDDRGRIGVALRHGSCLRRPTSCGEAVLAGPDRCGTVGRRLWRPANRLR